MWNENITRKHNVQKVKMLIFPVNTTVPIYAMYIMPINLTPKGTYTKLSVSHQYLRQIGQTYAVIPENHMNKTFQLSCRMPWLRNNDSLYWSPLLIPYGRRVFRRRLQYLSRAFLVRSVHSGLWLWSNRARVVCGNHVLVNRSVLRQETSRAACVSNYPGGRLSFGSHDYRFHQHIVFDTWCML